MTIVSAAFSISFAAFSTLCSLLSFAVSFAILPVILSIDIARILVGPPYDELGRSLARANSYWGWKKWKSSSTSESTSSSSWTRKSTGSTTVAAKPPPQPARPESSFEHPLRHPCPMANLPSELKLQIFTELLHSNDSPGAFNCTSLLLSKHYCDLFRPQLYTRIHIASWRRFRLLRETLAMHNPSLGSSIRRLILAADAFDSTGYVTDSIAKPDVLSKAIEPLLLCTPRLDSLALDLYSLAALWEHNGNLRLQSGPKPRKLQVELTFPQYLDLPLNEEVEELDIMCFGLGEDVARELRLALPRLKRLTIRLVRRKENARAEPTRASISDRRAYVRSALNALGVSSIDQVRSQDIRARMTELLRENLPGSGSDSDSEDLASSTALWSDTPLGHNDAEEFCRGIHVLRSWPMEKTTCGDKRALQTHGDRLEAVTVLSWPSAIRELQSRLQSTPNASAKLCRTQSQLDMAVQIHRAHMTALETSPLVAPDASGQTRSPSDASRIPLSPVRLDLDSYRKEGPRRGCVRAWVDGG